MMEREAMSSESLQLLGLMLKTKQHKRDGLNRAVPNKTTPVFVKHRYSMKRHMSDAGNSKANIYIFKARALLSPNPNILNPCRLCVCCVLIMEQ